MRGAMWQSPQAPGKPRIEARAAYGRASSFESGAPCTSSTLELHQHPIPLQVLIKDGQQAASQHLHVKAHQHIELRPLESCSPSRVVPDSHVPATEPMLVIGGHQRQQRDVMRKITTAGSLQELQHVVATYDTVLQPIHLSGALVKAARLAASTRAQPEPTPLQQQELRVAGDLAHQLGSRFYASSHHGSLGARQVANTMWALGQLQYRVPSSSNQGDLPAQLMAAGQQSLQQANPVEIAALAHGLAKLKQMQLQVWESVSAAALTCLPACGPQELVSLAWAAATIGSCAASDHTRAEDRSQHQQLTSLMHSLMRAVIDRAQQLGEGLQGRELVQVLWAAAKLGLHGNSSEGLFGTALPRLERMLVSGGMSTQDVANIVWACAKAHHHTVGRSLLATVTQVLGGPGGCQFKHLRPSKFKAQELSSVMWAAATMTSTDARLLSIMATELSARSASLGSQAIANSAWAAAKLGYHNPSFMSSMVEAAARQASHFKPQELSNLLWAVASQPPGREADVSQASDAGGLATLEACASRAAASMSPAALAQVSVYIRFRHRWHPAHPSQAHGDAPRSDRQHRSHEQPQDPGGSCAPSEPAHTARLRRLAEATARSALTQAHKFKAQDLVALVRGLSSMPHAVDPSVMRAIGDAAVQLVLGGAFRPDSLPALLAGFVCLGCTHRTLAQAVGRVVQGSLSSLDMEALTHLLWAMAAMHVHDKQLLRKAAAALQQGPLACVHLQSPPPLPAGRTTRSASLDSGSTSTPWHHVGEPLYDDRPRSGSASLLKQLGWEEDGEEEHKQDVLRTALQFTGQLPELRRMESARGHSSSSSSSSSRNGTQQQPLFKQEGHDGTAEQHSSSQQVGTRPSTWAILAWAFARCGFHQHQLYEKLAAAVLNQPGASHACEPACCDSDSTGSAGTSVPSSVSALSHLPTICLVQLLWAFAMMDHSHPSLLAAASATLSHRIHSGELTPREVATVAWAYARLQHYEAPLFSAVLQEAVTHAERYNLRNWSRLAWAFSTLCLPAEEAFHVRLTRLQEEASRRQREPVPEGPYSPLSLSYSGRYSSGSSQRQPNRRPPALARPRRPRSSRQHPASSPSSAFDDELLRAHTPQRNSSSLGPN